MAELQLRVSAQPSVIHGGGTLPPRLLPATPSIFRLPLFSLLSSFPCCHFFSELLQKPPFSCLCFFLSCWLPPPAAPAHLPYDTTEVQEQLPFPFHPQKKKVPHPPFYSLHFEETEQQGQVCHIDLCISLCGLLLTMEVRLHARGVPLSVCVSRRSAVKQIRPTAARWPSRSRPTVWLHKSFCSEIFPLSEGARIISVRRLQSPRCENQQTSKKKKRVSLCESLTQK